MVQSALLSEFLFSKILKRAELSAKWKEMLKDLRKVIISLENSSFSS